MKEINLSQNKIALIDDEDFELVNQYQWYALKRRVKFVAAVKHKINVNKSVIVLMHRLIMNAPSNMEVDHKNHDTLDNRKQNLRLATSSQNNSNKTKYANNRTGYKGVFFIAKTGRFRSRINFQHLRHDLGYFATSEEAARAYDAKAKELQGEFAVLNFPDCQKTNYQETGGV